ncbi:hypothetical protein EDD15DRAFT_294348 [Pisolithus albus]|nr:hypothetical protein EDD15DRAFT_294348 [Pisolithus albus]
MHDLWRVLELSLMLTSCGRRDKLRLLTHQRERHHAYNDEKVVMRMVSFSLSRTLQAFRHRPASLLRYFHPSFSGMSYPASMYAITIAKTGGPEVLEKTEIPFPVVEPGHLVVKIDYAGVNFIDIYFREGIYSSDKPFPFVIGKEGAGTVIGLPTDPAVRDDPEFQKRGYKIGSRVSMAPTQNTFLCHGGQRTQSPDSIPASIAAATLIQGVTAISFMEEAYTVKEGDIILIHTIAGGLGTLMCQFAKSRGAVVIGTTSTKEKAEFAKKNGADHVILYKDEDTVARVLEITNGEGVHAIFDGVGKDTRKGTLVSVGNASGAVPPFAPLKLVEKNMKLVRPTMGNYSYTPGEVLYYANALSSHLLDGTLKPLIHKEYPFTTEGVREAHMDLTAGKTIGKLLIRISE